MAETILLIDDDKPIVELVSRLLKGCGYEVYSAPDAQSGLRMAYQRQPDLILLEVVLPDRDGWDVCRQLRDLSDMPIVFVSARADTSDVIQGLEAGADDYIAKPFDDGELVARVKARLRRSPKTTIHEEYVFNNGDLRINFMNREVWIRNRLKHLTPKEFNLLVVLARNAGRDVSRRELATEAWGDEYGNAIDSLKLYIHYLRQKLETDPRKPEYILTARGVGYRFVQR